jgi:hypothetical protein
MCRQELKNAKSDRIDRDRFTAELHAIGQPGMRAP